MGVFRLGNLIRFIPKAVVVWLTSSIAGGDLPCPDQGFPSASGSTHLPGGFFGKMKALLTHLDTLDLPTVALSIASDRRCCRGTGWPGASKFLTRLPGPLRVLVIATVANAAPAAAGPETIGSRCQRHSPATSAFALPSCRCRPSAS